MMKTSSLSWANLDAIEQRTDESWRKCSTGDGCVRGSAKRRDGKASLWLYWATEQISLWDKKGRATAPRRAPRPREGATGEPASQVCLVESGVSCRSNVPAPITLQGRTSVCVHKRPQPVSPRRLTLGLVIEPPREGKCGEWPQLPAVSAQFPQTSLEIYHR